MNRMIRVGSILSVLFAVCAGTLLAQPSQAQYDSLSARVVLLEKIINVAGFMGRQIPCSEMGEARPPTYFPNGEYDISYRQKQLGCGVNDIYHLDSTLAARLEARMPPSGRTVPEYVNSAVAAIPANSTGGNSSATGAVQMNLGDGIIMHDTNVAPSSTMLLYHGGGDNGLRLLYNHLNCWPCTDRTYGSYAIPTLAQTRIDFEQDGVISMNGNKPWSTAAGSYDALGGKALLFGVLGHSGVNGQRGKYVEFYGGQVGRGLRLGVSDTDANWPTRWALQIEGDNSANPVSVFIDGASRQLKSCNIGGVTVVCF